MNPTPILNAVIVGAGSRGANVFAELMATHDIGYVVRGVVEPNDHRREAFQSRFGVEQRYTFRSVDDFLDSPRFADIVFVATPDQTHYELCRRLSEHNYDLVLEKPIATNLGDCNSLLDVETRYGNAIFVAHVLRYSPIIREIKNVLDSGELGSLRHIQLIENIGYWHFAHSYVRGKWRRTDESAPIILTKACHDLDLLQWFADEPVEFVSSAGALTYFTEAYAPADAAERCTDCPRSRDCLYSAPAFYLRDRIGWPFDVIVDGLPDTPEHRIRALEEGPYGRCVFRNDNDVCDNQLVTLEFQSGLLANFALHAHTADNTREVTLLCDRGEISANVQRDHLKITTFSPSDCQTRLASVDLPRYGDSHGGGDLGLLVCVHEQLTRGKHDQLMTSLRASILSHQLAFRAEDSRLQGGVRLPVADVFAPRYLEPPSTRSA